MKSSISPASFRQSALGLLSTLFLGAAFAGEGPSPLPALPPEPRTLQLDAGKGLRPADRPDAEGQRGLIDDAIALRRAVARVRAALGQAAAAPAHDAKHPASPGVADAPRSAHEPSGAPRSAARFGEALLVQRFADGTATVTSSIERQPAEEVCRELSALLGRGFDDATLAAREADGHVGLKALRGLVGDGGGSLRVRSTPGSNAVEDRGTTMTVEIPLP